MCTCMPGSWTCIRPCLPLGSVPSEMSRLHKQAEGLAGPAEQPQLPEPLTIKVTVWQVGATSSHRPFRGTTPRAGKKARSGGPELPHLLQGRGRAFTLKTGAKGRNRHLVWLLQGPILEPLERPGTLNDPSAPPMGASRTFVAAIWPCTRSPLLAPGP